MMMVIMMIIKMKKTMFSQGYLKDKRDRMCKAFTTELVHSTVPNRILTQQKEFMYLEENPVGTIFLTFLHNVKGLVYF